MKITVNQKCFSGIQGNMFPGQEYELPDAVAERLIRSGIAQEAKKKAGRPPKKADRSVGLQNSEFRTVTPEDDA